jgi:hypothetical protein
MNVHDIRLLTPEGFSMISKDILSRLGPGPKLEVIKTGTQHLNDETIASIPVEHMKDIPSKGLTLRSLNAMTIEQAKALTRGQVSLLEGMVPLRDLKYDMKKWLILFHMKDFNDASSVENMLGMYGSNAIAQIKAIREEARMQGII